MIREAMHVWGYSKRFWPTQQVIRSHSLMTIGKGYILSCMLFIFNMTSTSHLLRVLGVPYVLSHSVLSNSLHPYGLQPSRLLCPWNFPGKDTGVGFHSLLQGIFQTQGSNLGLLHCRQIPYHLSSPGKPIRGRDQDEFLWCLTVLPLLIFKSDLTKKAKSAQLHF